MIDCDVIEADGGTRTASITGGFIALAMALGKLGKKGTLRRPALRIRLRPSASGMSMTPWRSTSATPKTARRAST